jgi:hypothetical protein
LRPFPTVVTTSSLWNPNQKNHQLPFSSHFILGRFGLFCFFVYEIVLAST